jgi:hypothetical protein
MIAFAQQLIAAAAAHQLMAISIVAGGGIGRAGGYRNQDAEQGELRSSGENISGFQS